MFDNDIHKIRNRIAQQLKIAERAVTASYAQRWLGEYGGYLAKSGPDGAQVKVHLNYASSTAWVENGREYLDMAANEMLPAIVERAMELAGEHLAQGMEAAAAGETRQGLDPKGESPVGNADAPDTTPSPSNRNP